jgi:hypothetical protein
MEYARVHFSINSCRNQNISFGTFGRKMNNLVLFTVCQEHNKTLSRTFMEDLIETLYACKVSHCRIFIEKIAGLWPSIKENKSL